MYNNGMIDIYVISPGQSANLSKDDTPYLFSLLELMTKIEGHHTHGPVR